MKPKWLYFLLALFVIFLIWSNADATGQEANAFFGWLGQLLDRTFDFLDSLFDGAGSGGDDGTHST